MFYVLTIQKFMDESAEAKSIFDYSTEDEAKAVLFSTMASSMVNQNMKQVICMMLNEIGVTTKYERWSRVAEVPERVL
jgi:hypothetical protein